MSGPGAGVTGEATGATPGADWGGVRLDGIGETGSGDANPAVPAARANRRLGPELDPLTRFELGLKVKWGLVLGFLLLLAYFPLRYSVAGPQKGPHALWAVLVATVLATVAATFLSRLALPKLFGKWNEAVDAFRDWTIISVITGGLYLLMLAVLRRLPEGNPLRTASSGPGDPSLFDPGWLKYRLPFVLLAAVIGLIAARFLVTRQSASERSLATALPLIAVQALLIGLFTRPLERALNTLSLSAIPSVLALLAGGALMTLCLGTLLWAYSTDKQLIELHKKRGDTGVAVGGGAVPLTLTIVGGRESGKTVFLAAAYWEWALGGLGNLRIEASKTASHAYDTAKVRALPEGPGTSSGNVSNLQQIADNLYRNRQFPAGNVFNTVLDYDLFLGDEHIAHLSLLDFPGGALVGRAASAEIVNEFWDRVENTDGILFIADSHFVRAGTIDSDYLDIFKAYNEVMRRVMARNRKSRVIPVALVATKCDEWVNPETGKIDTAELKNGLREFRYHQLEEGWRRFSQEMGPRVVEFTTWVTTAITHSEPQPDENGVIDFSRPFVPTLRRQITPTGCAAPLLWLSAKILRWNVTLFRDLSGFLSPAAIFNGSSTKIRSRIQAIEELERIASEQAIR